MFINLEYKDYTVDRRQPQVVLRCLLFTYLKISISLLLGARSKTRVAVDDTEQH